MTAIRKFMRKEVMDSIAAIVLLLGIASLVFFCKPTDLVMRILFMLVGVATGWMTKRLYVEVRWLNRHPNA